MTNPLLEFLFAFGFGTISSAIAVVSSIAELVRSISRTFILRGTFVH